MSSVEKSLVMMVCVEKGPTSLGDRESMTSVVVRMRQVPMPTDHLACTIGIVLVITHWPRTLAAASTPHVALVHAAFHRHTREFPSAVFEWFDLHRLGAQSLAIAVPVVGPPVTTGLVQQGPVAMCSSTIHVQASKTPPVNAASMVTCVVGM
jgi:hypothetical protein